MTRWKPKAKSKNWRRVSASRQVGLHDDQIPLRSLLHNRKNVQPVISHLAFEMNDLVIHTYQFIRLYVITCFSNQTDLPVVDEPFVLYCLRVLGTRDNRGRHIANVGLLERLETFYNVEYQPLLHHEKTDLKNKPFLFPHLATQIHTSLSNNAQERFVQHFLRFVNKTTTNITDDKATLSNSNIMCFRCTMKRTSDSTIGKPLICHIFYRPTWPSLFITTSEYIPRVTWKACSIWTRCFLGCVGFLGCYDLL